MMDGNRFDLNCVQPRASSGRSPNSQVLWLALRRVGPVGDVCQTCRHASAGDLRRSDDVLEGIVGLAWLPVHVDDAPPLFVEGLVGVGAAARRDAADVVDGLAAVAVLPPLVAELEEEAAKELTPFQGAPLHDLLCEHLGGVRLGLLVLGVAVGVEGIRPVLAEEEGLAAPAGELLDGVAEAEAVVDVHAPDVDLGQTVNDVAGRGFAVDGCHRVLVVDGLDELRHLLHAGHGLHPAPPLVEAVVVPLVAHDPHENGRMVLHGIDLLLDLFERFVGVGKDSVEDVNAI
mmetsp:Transcript_72746/g.193204  ORF Transcript_72746/g.193204 Transcript_72746/m.193204 type:complete len:288 (+) Transcript_72746:23-886(+)